ncbi:MAG: hypothetical protein INR71_06310 [Terriglobus roseus]|nr:hypothetical protein [Terriglobus roseus]
MIATKPGTEEGVSALRGYESAGQRWSHDQQDPMTEIEMGWQAISMSWMVPEPWRRSPWRVAWWTLAMTSCICGIATFGYGEHAVALGFLFGTLLIAGFGEAVFRRDSRRHT